MLEPDDLSPTDEKILEMLRDGRVTAPFVAEEKDISLQYARDRLGRMVEHGNARKVYEGLYELVEDPREGGADQADDVEPVADPVDDTGGFMPPVVGLEFEKQPTDKRVMVVEEWLEHVRADGRVQKSDFESWYTDEHADRTGYEPGGFWDFFVKPAMRQVEGIDQPNSRTYVWVGRE
jgi:hypothetical protein